MCGIAAILDPAGGSDLVERLLRMHAPIRHRGPDGEGFLVASADARVHRRGAAGELPPDARPVVGLAFRRLKILDLSEAASQPLASRDGSCWIVFNGEIYNFRRLRDELARGGHAFESSGDTEVLLAAYERWGNGCFERLDGMWAAVILDLKRRLLVASRDRFGIKPLYWSMQGSRLLLASEIKQILAAGEPPRPSAAMIERYLRGRRTPMLEDTFFEGIQSVAPASWFEVSMDFVEPRTAPSMQRYWDLADACRSPSPRTYSDAREEFEEILSGAVESHRIADVRVGSLLSGGLDSAVLTSLLSDAVRSDGGEPPSFSFGFREAAPRFCELPYVDAMVREKRLVNFETTFDSLWVAEHAGRVVRALEEPPLGMPALAQYRIFELCRIHDCTVVLDGEGADEILGGYPYHQRLLLLDRLRRRRLLDFGKELTDIARRESRSSAAVLSEYFLAPIARRAARRNGWLAPPAASPPAAARIDSSPDPSLVNRRLFYDLKWGNAKLVLSYTDKTAMAHSVEARVPYFDRRLVEFAFSLPDDFKVGAGDRKRILRDTARRTVPPAITERADRMGFGTPDAWLLRGETWPLVRSAILDEPSFADGWVDREGMRRFVEGFEKGLHSDARAVWRLYALALWRREFRV